MSFLLALISVFYDACWKFFTLFEVPYDRKVGGLCSYSLGDFNFSQNGTHTTYFFFFFFFLIFGRIISCVCTSLTRGIRPNIEEEAKNALVARFDSILTDNGATVVESKDWEKRRLAYEIQDFREGLYHVVNVESDNDFALNEFDRLSKINGDILRHMIVKLDA